MGIQPGHTSVANIHRDTVHMRTVWNTEDGLQPVVALDAKATAAEKVAAKAKAAGVASFTLALGSADDDNDDAREAEILQPEVSVPNWALKLYRMQPLFQNMEATNKLRISLPR